MQFAYGFLFFQTQCKNAYIHNMLTFQKDSGIAFGILTLTELTTLSSPLYYLFVFMHIETKQKVKVIISSESDLSAFKYRYNKFEFNTGIFSSAPVGMYNYTVYEQASAIDETEEGKTIVESGKLKLTGSQFEFEKYNTTTIYKSYNG